MSMSDWTDVLCEESFTCVKYIYILSNKIDVDILQFVIMLMGAFAIQMLSNYIWTQHSQTTRELLQKLPEDRGGCCHGILSRSMLWTLISTSIWISKIVLIMGNNIWIYGAILGGNLVGTLLTQRYQKPDHHYLVDDIDAMVTRYNKPEDNEVRDKINASLKALKKAMDSKVSNKGSLFF